MTTRYFMAIDQYGNHYHGLKHPRKDLMAALDCKHVDKMYRDTEEGTVHVGYVIRGHWLNLFEVIPMRRPA